MNSTARTISGWFFALAALGVAGGAAWKYRAQWRPWAAELGLGRSGERSPMEPGAGKPRGHVDDGTSADPLIRIEVGGKGFSPETVSVSPGEDRVLEFTRTAEKTCVTAVVFPATGKRFELPLGEAVRVPIAITAGETISFSCPMDMYRGTVAASGDSEAPNAEHVEDDGHAASEVAHWTCSMHPSVKSQTPGTCPICSMDLIPVTRGEIETGIILVDAQRRQLIGVTTGTVARRALTAEVRTVGRVLADETRLTEVTLRYEAWIGQVFADFRGKVVRKGEPMFSFFNPQLWSLQEEYLEALRRGQGVRASGGDLAGAAETRLRLLGIDPAQIEALRRRGSATEYLVVNAPVSGTILEKHLVAGGAVPGGMALYRIADLSSVWIEAEVYGEELARIAVGQVARIALQGVPGHEFEGAVSYVYPAVDAVTRTGRVRFEVANPDGELKLDMYADIRITLPLGERLAVPEGAVIYAGASVVAFVDLGEGRLEPRRLKVGTRTADYIEVLEGLAEGETVVTSANFLIAAESKLKSGIEKW